MVRRAALVLAVAAACTGTSAAPDQASEGAVGPSATALGETTVPSETTSAATGATAGGGGAGSALAACPDGSGIPWSRTMAAQAEPLIEDGAVRVEAVIYPHAEHEGNPWSQWGQGIVTQDNRFFSAVGDHLGADGNSYIYEYDPESKQLSMIADVLGVVGHEPGSWGYGKIHAQMVEGACGVYVATYWGTRRGLAFDDVYRGDHLLRLDPVAETIADLSVILPEYGVPSLASSPEHGRIYAEAVDPFQEPNTGWFVVLDEAGHGVFKTDAPHVGFRAMAVDDRGRAFFSAGDGSLAVYDPVSNDLVETIEALPGTWLRAATAPGPDGTIYGVTREPDALFALGTDGTVRDMGPVLGYTTSLALSPDGSTVYYVPFAHGGSWRSGTPLVAVDTATGEESIVALLNEAAEERLGLTLGGTYNLAMSPDGSTLYVGMNAGVVGGRDTFGSIVLLIVHLDP